MGAIKMALYILRDHPISIGANSPSEQKNGRALYPKLTGCARNPLLGYWAADHPHLNSLQIMVFGGQSNNIQWLPQSLVG